LHCFFVPASEISDAIGADAVALAVRNAAGELRGRAQAIMANFI